MEFTCRVSKDGGMNCSERKAGYFKQYLRNNLGMVLRITPVLRVATGRAKIQETSSAANYIMNFIHTGDVARDLPSAANSVLNVPPSRVREIEFQGMENGARALGNA
jgi:hypothetical protein